MGAEIEFVGVEYLSLCQCSGIHYVYVHVRREASGSEIEIGHSLGVIWKPKPSKITLQDTHILRSVVLKNGLFKHN